MPSVERIGSEGISVPVGRVAVCVRSLTVARTLAATWMIAGALTACESGGAVRGEWAGTVDTLSSGALRIRNPEQGVWRDGEEWVLEEELRIGALASDGPDQFAYIQDLTVDARGYVYVLDGPSRELRVFDEGGGFVRRIGGKGQGPGELAAPVELEWGPGGHLWVADSGNHRYEVFDTAGVYQGSHRYDPGMYRYGDRWGSDGLLHTVVLLSGAQYRPVIVRRRISDAGLVPVDTLPAFGFDFGETVAASFVRDGRRMTAMIPLPFQSTSVAAHEAGRGWWLSHPGREYRIARVDSQGDTLLLVERPYTPIAVTEEDLDRALTSLARNLDIPREGIPGVHPPVRKLLPLPDGHLLVEREGPTGATMDVFDPGGIYLGALHTEGVPPTTVHLARDRALYGVVRDGMDVPYVVRMGIRRRP